MKVLGIDPGLATVGLGLVALDGKSPLRAVEWLTIESDPGPLPLRLEELARDLREYLEETNPDAAVIEKLYFQTNVKTAIDVAQARGVLLLTVQERGIPILEPNPLELKLAVTGDGRADKRQVRDMLMLTLKLTEPPTPDDAADALALAVYGATMLGGGGAVLDREHVSPSAARRKVRG